jgi:hypothetical protein
MKMLRGKHKTTEFTIDQFCNDWMTVNPIGVIPGNIVSVLQVKLTPEEVTRVRDKAAAGNTGIMFDTFELSDEGIFTRKF